MKRFVCILLVFSGLCGAEPKTEMGEINGARFRIEMPENWNGGLIMYCHGYSPVPGNFDNPKPNPALNNFVSEGYAVAQSGYSAGGWAIEEAVQDTEGLRRYFVKRYGAPKETYVTGHSMGGFLTMELVEKFPNEYDGGLALCGPLAPASWFMERNVFDMRVVFDYYFPGVLPSPAKVPENYAVSPALNADIQKLLDGQPEKSAALRRYTGIHTNKDLAATLVFFTYILKDLQQRGHGNPFDNHNTIYSGTDDDNALNDGVTRYTGDVRAAEYIRLYYTPSGHLTRPLLAIHTTYDQLVPAWVTNAYSTIAGIGGGERFFVQQYVKRDGHCAILPAEIGRGFTQLRQWKATGTRPPAGENR
jgi:pimeloyl-ACP methyl ester carboxylesterase